MQAKQNNNALSLHHDGSVAYLQSDYTDSGSFSPLALQMTGGNVGVGTPSPGYKLTVAGDIYANGGWLRTSGNQGWYSESYGGGWFMEDSSWIRTYNAKNVWTAGGLLGSQGGLTIGYSGATPSSGGAIIAGNVGLGTTTPGSRLDIGGAAGASLYSTLAIKQSAIGAQKGIWLQANQNNNSLFMSHDGNSGFIGTDYTGTDGFLTRLYFIAHGKDINIGTVAVPSHLIAWANIYYHGELIKRSSDTRIKVDRRQLDYGLTNVMALNPIRYNQAEWEINPETEELIIHSERISKTNEIGLVAQEVQQVIPEAVSVPEDETRQTWGLNYIKLIPVLIKAIQEQQEMIKEQKEINAAQEAKIKSLEERIAALEQK